jgi:hypothetical protein
VSSQGMCVSGGLDHNRAAGGVKFLQLG